MSAQERILSLPERVPEAAPVVWIVDPHPIVRAGMKSQMAPGGFAVGWEGASPADMTAPRAGSRGPAIIIMDASYGPTAVRNARAGFPDSRIVVFGEHAEISAVGAAFEAGADGYILKSISAPALLDSLRLVQHGEKIFPGLLTGFLNGARHGSGDMSGRDRRVGDVVLSERELDIVRGLSRGHTNKRIANALNVTEATVKVNLKTVLRKLGLSNRTQVAIWAVQNHVEQDGVALSPS